MKFSAEYKASVTVNLNVEKPVSELDEIDPNDLSLKEITAKIEMPGIGSFVHESRYQYFDLREAVASALEDLAESIRED